MILNSQVKVIWEGLPITWSKNNISGNCELYYNAFFRIGWCVLGSFAYTSFLCINVDIEVFWINCFFTCFAVSVIILHVLLSLLLFYSSTGICNQHILHFFYSFTIFVSCSEPEVRFLTQTTYLWYVNTSDTGTYLKWEGSVLLHVTYIIISFSCDNHNLNI